MENKKPSPETHLWGSVLFRLLSTITTKYAKTVVVLTLLLTALLAWYTKRNLDFVTDRNQLISSEKRYLQLDDEYSDIFHGLEQMVVVAKGPDLEETKKFVQVLNERLKADAAHVKEVFYHIDSTSLAGKELLLLSAEDLRSVRDKIDES